MTAPRNVPLIERRADARDLSQRISEHKHDGQRCKPACAELVKMRKDLAAIREELRTWFDPGPDQPDLFGGA